MNAQLAVENYSEVLGNAKKLIGQTQENFLTMANRYGMEMRWALGKLIDENSIRYDWGKSVIGSFAQDLCQAFPGSKSFSSRNLTYMRQFYSEYKKTPELLELAKNVRWGTNISIMTKVKSVNARLFYLEMAGQTQCSRQVIIAQISSNAYERECLQNKQHNFNRMLPEVIAARADNVMKSSYLFEVFEPLGATRQIV